MADSDLQRRAREYVRHVVVSSITAKSGRDLQKLPGPSDLADTCNRCLAFCLGRAAGLLPQSNHKSFSLKAWVGTAIHEKLEREVPKHFSQAIVESTVPVAHIKNLGQVIGHVDLRFGAPVAVDFNRLGPDSIGQPGVILQSEGISRSSILRQPGVIIQPQAALGVDYKTTDMDKLRKYQRYGVPTYHAGQILLYGYALRKAGLGADVLLLVYIPRDSNQVSDIWVASCEYREDVPLNLLARAEDLLVKVAAGESARIAPSDDCYVCTVQSRLH